MTVLYDQQCSSSIPTVHENTLRWPAHLAKDVADNIHRCVVDTLGKSRLVRKMDGIKFARKEDILKVHGLLGSGAFSVVSDVTAKDGRRYACKHLKQKLMDQPDNFSLAASELAYEAHMLASFDHPNILRIHGWAENGVASFADGCHDSFFLLLDRLDETLDQRIDRWQAEERQMACVALASVQPINPALHSLSGLPDWLNGWAQLPANQVHPTVGTMQVHDLRGTLHSQFRFLEKLRIMMDIASALEYIHASGVIFRDLKPNNIGFLNDKVKLFDFGLSRELPMLDATIPFDMSGKVGTLRYMAPEVAMHQPYNIPADVYSWAIVSYEMLSLQKPFDGWTREMHASIVCAQGVRPNTNCSPAIPLDIRVLLEGGWHAQPTSRPTIPQILAQLSIVKEHNIFLFLEEYQLQMELQIQQAQQEAAAQAVAAAAAAAATAVYVDMQYCLAQSPPQKMYRSVSLESIGTIETASLSADSHGYF